MTTVAPSQAATKSTFVTALAWIFIALAAFATLVSVSQNIMVNVMFPAVEMQAMADQAKAHDRIPWFVTLMARHVRIFFLAFLVLSAGTLVSAIGLLKRKNWARILFVALMIFGILWNIAGVALSVVLLSAMPAIPANAPPGFADQFETMSRVMIGFNVVIAIAFTVLFGWIIKRLVSPEIRSEFSPA